jgi:hypothetical protein
MPIERDSCAPPGVVVAVDGLMDQWISSGCMLGTEPVSACRSRFRSG